MPELDNAVMICAWPGIGNVGVIAVDFLRSHFRAEALGEIEPWDFLEPSEVSAEDRSLENSEPPTHKLHFKRLASRDLVFFLSDEQPASSEKGYQMARLVLDVAQRFNCKRVYAVGGRANLIHHSVVPRVLAVPNSENLTNELEKYPNIILGGEIAEIEERVGQDKITGMVGLLLRAAKERHLEAVCLMGETPDWLSGAPFPYPKASKSVCQILAGILGIQIDYGILDDMAGRIETTIEKLCEKMPQRFKESYDRRKPAAQLEVITEAEAEWLKGHIDQLFEGGTQENRTFS